MTHNEYKVFWHRLKIMTPGEMWYRFHRNFRARLEKKRLPPHPKDLSSLLAGNKQIISHDHAETLLTTFRQRRVFPWQTLSDEKIAGLFNAQWPEEKKACLDAADNICAHRYKVFNRVLSFNGQIDWHYDVIAQKQIPLKHWTQLPYWQSDTAQGVKYIWELNRLQHFVTLAKAYLLTAEEKYCEELLRQWQDWLEKNPPRYGINWTSPLEMAMRIISFTWSLQMVKKSQQITADFYRQVLLSIADHAENIAENLSFYSSANNHLLGEALGLVYAGCYYPELQQAIKWRDLGYSIIFDQIPRQVYSDGVIKEQTTYYQKYVFDYCLLAQIAGEFIGQHMSATVTQRMEKMAEFIHALMDESGDVPDIGDADGGQTVCLSERPVEPYRLLLSSAACLFNNGVFKAKGVPWCEELFWLFGEDAQEKFDQIESKESTSMAQEFHEGGYVVLRSRDGAIPQRAVLDAGPLGLDAMSSHGHADALSFVLSAAGDPILIDSGTFTYRGSRRWRDYFRSTFAHNTIVVDDTNQSEMVGPFQWGRRAHAQILSCSMSAEQTQIIAHHDGYRHKGITHIRRILFDHSDHWLIEDTVQGSGTHSIKILWHFAPCEYKLEVDGILILHFPRSLVSIRTFAQIPLRHEVIIGQKYPIQGWYSPEFAIKKMNPVFCIQTQEVLPVQITTEINIQKT